MNSAAAYKECFAQFKEKPPPYECPKCHKLLGSITGIHYHMKKVCPFNKKMKLKATNDEETPAEEQSPPAVVAPESPPPPVLPPVVVASTPKPQQPQTPTPCVASSSNRKSRLKSLKKKKASRAARSPSPIELNQPLNETLTWAEAQRMVIIEHQGQQFKLDIDQKIPVTWDESGNTNAHVAAQEDAGKTDTSKKQAEPTTATIKLVAETPQTQNKKGRKSSSCKNINKSKMHNNHPPPIQEEKKPLPVASFRVLDEAEWAIPPAAARPESYYRYIEPTPDRIEEEVEYDLDEQDMAWLEIVNHKRDMEGVAPIDPNDFEMLIDRFEKESYFEQSKNGLNSNNNQTLIDEDAVCCVCNDGECQNTNQILFCDLCNLAVHQECYGVPYIPEGQWLCRRCLQSPSCPVDCCLCPSKNGAFKQTDDGRWSHVVCALWVPEVGFSNTVFLEPIDSLKRIPAARWKLTCYVCKQRNVGACIQCNKPNCYTAFHVTCAQQAGLYMKMEPVKRQGRNGSTQVHVKQEAFCDAHTPPDASPRPNQKHIQGGECNSEEKLKKARQLLAEKRHEVPQISVPLIPKDKMQEIAKKQTFQRKNAFLRRLLSYWTLKRQERNGVPLLRRLQSTASSRKNRDPKENAQMQDQLKYWNRMRHDLERARLLSELIRKREKLKREDVRLWMSSWEIKAIPLNHFMRTTLDKLRDFDVTQVFHMPVSVKEAPNYYKIVKNPMDFHTMTTKVDNLEYESFDDFENDFNLIIANCKFYNSPASHFYGVAVKMKEKGSALLRLVRRDIDNCGINKYGMLSELPASTQQLAIASSPSSKSDANSSAAIQEQIDRLNVEIDVATINGRKFKKLKANLLSLKRKQQMMRKNNSDATGQRLNESDKKNVDSNNKKNKTAEAADDDEVEEEEKEEEEEKKEEKSPRKKTKSSSDNSVDDFVVTASSQAIRGRRKTFTAAPRHQDNSDDVTTTTKGRKRARHERHSESAALSPPAGGGSGRRKRTRHHRFNHEDNTDDDASAASTNVTAPRRSRDSSEDQSARGSAAAAAAPSGSRKHGSWRRSKSIEQQSSTDGMLDGMNKQGGGASYMSSSEEDDDDEQDRSQLHPLDLVWAKCRGYPPYPAMLIDPEMPKSGMLHNGVPIPVPPPEVIQAASEMRPSSSSRHHHGATAASSAAEEGDGGGGVGGASCLVPSNKNNNLFLVLFFDTKRTWQWLPRNKLEELGVSRNADQTRLNAIKKPTVRKNVNAAYQRALNHRKRVDKGDDDDRPFTLISPSPFFHNT